MAAKKNKTQETLTEQPAAAAPEAEAVCVEKECETLCAQCETAPAETNETSETQAIAETEDHPMGNKRIPKKEKVLTKAQKRKRILMKAVLLNVGIIMMSISVYFFQTPNNFTLGGVAGIAILLANLIPIEFFSQAVIMAIINVFLLILGLVILGKQCTFLTIYCSLLYTGIIWLLEIILPMSSITETGTLTDQPFLEMVYAILLFGVGGALVFNCGASSGGTDIIALILKKFTKINVGVALMIIDLIVVCIAIFTFNSVTTALFSFMGLFAKSFLLDSVIESIGKTKYITIVTKHAEEIGNFILDVINHSYTSYDAEGGYTHDKKKVLITVCKRGEALKLKMKVKQLDPEAFVIVTNANEILGKGFVESI